jgi:hypothetical protein
VDAPGEEHPNPTTAERAERIRRALEKDDRAREDFERARRQYFEAVARLRRLAR